MRRFRFLIPRSLIGLAPPALIASAQAIPGQPIPAQPSPAQPSPAQPEQPVQIAVDLNARTGPFTPASAATAMVAEISMRPMRSAKTFVGVRTVITLLSLQIFVATQNKWRNQAVQIRSQVFDECLGDLA
jgi:hypothetical protein